MEHFPGKRTMYIDAPHLRKHLDTRKVQIAGQAVCRRFAEVLDNPALWNMAATYLDWDYETAVRINLARESESDIAEKIRDSSLSRFTHLLVLYVEDQPGLYAKILYGLCNLDSFFWRAPGPRYMCGATVQDGVFEPSFNDIIEYNGGDWLTFNP